MFFNVCFEKLYDPLEVHKLYNMLTEMYVNPLKKLDRDSHIHEGDNLTKQKETTSKTP